MLTCRYWLRISNPHAYDGCMNDTAELATAIRVIWTNRSEAGYTLDTADLNTIPA